MLCQSQIIINTGRNTRPVLRPVGDYPQRAYQCSHALRIAPGG